MQRNIFVSLRDRILLLSFRKVPAEGTIVPQGGHFSAVGRHFFVLRGYRFCYLPDVNSVITSMQKRLAVFVSS